MKAKSENAKLHHIEIHPAANGYTVEHHYQIRSRSNDNDTQPYSGDFYPNHREEAVFGSAEEASDHVADTLEEHEESREKGGSYLAGLGRKR